MYAKVYEFERNGKFNFIDSGGINSSHIHEVRRSESRRAVDKSVFENNAGD